MGVGAKRPRGRPAVPKDVQRKRLIDAAVRAFERTNFEKTTVADILGEAGMSSRSFYEFFDSKDDLVAELVHQRGRELIDRIDALFRGVDDEVARLDAGLQVYMNLFPAMAVDFDRLGGRAGQRVAELRTEYVRRTRDLVIQHMEKLSAGGEGSAAPDPVELELVLTGIEGLTFRYCSEGRRDEIDSLRPAILRLMARAFL